MIENKYFVLAHHSGHLLKKQYNDIKTIRDCQKPTPKKPFTAKRQRKEHLQQNTHGELKIHVQIPKKSLNGACITNIYSKT